MGRLILDQLVQRRAEVLLLAHTGAELDLLVVRGRNAWDSRSSGLRPRP
jgi:hypothetical protein